jgi:hypothetical protein
MLKVLPWEKSIVEKNASPKIEVSHKSALVMRRSSRAARDSKSTRALADLTLETSLC